MRLRWLVLSPLLYAAAFAALAAWLHSGEDDGFVAGQRILMRLLAVAGCYAAASAFEAGDRLRRAWTWLVVGVLLILARDLLRLFPFFAPNPEPQAANILTALGILSNLAQLAGIWMLARSWRLVTLEMPGGRAGTAAIAVITAAVSLGVAGPGVLQAMRLDDLVQAVSSLVDIVTLCLTMPLLLTAVALRGGSFSWPWGLLTASQVSWLLYDVAVAAGFGPTGFPLHEVFRGLAGNLLGAAGLAQYLVVRHVRRRARRA